MQAASSFFNRSIEITNNMKEEAMLMLRLLGFPAIQAPSEAEAQCAAMAKSGKAFAVVSEDMDTLAFGAPVLLRNLSSRKEPLIAIHSVAMLAELSLS